MNEKYRILTDLICNHIYPNNLYNQQFQLRIASKCSLKVIYNKHIYIITIEKKKNIFYWILSSYKKQLFTTIIDGFGSFDVILQTIKDIDNKKNQWY